MKLLVAHNEYQQMGGEERVFLEEVAMLESRGHEVIRYERSNEAVKHMSRLSLARDTLWNPVTYRELREIIHEQRPDVVHLHNTFPLISPSACHAAAAEDVPVVMTLHNYRLLCPNGLFFRDGRPCEDCMGRSVPMPGVIHACYRDSRAATGVVAAMLAAHRMLGTWTEKVDAFVALTDFARRKFIEGGLPEAKIQTKPNFVYPDPQPGDGSGGYALFVGRLSPEKGLETLLSAWERPETRDVPLRIVGDGPLAGRVASFSQGNANVEWLGSRSADEVRSLMKGALALVFPSEWYETFGRVAVESFAAGTPVVTSDIGAAAELVQHGRTGLRFKPGEAGELAACVRRLIENPDERAHMRLAARSEFEARYTEEENYRRLMEIYRSVTDRVQVSA